MAAYCQEQNRAESEPDPGRDIELELCALDLEDPEQQEAQVSSKETNVKKKSAVTISSAAVFLPGCLQSPLTFLLLPWGRAPPDGGSLHRQAGRSPAEEDGLQVTSSDLYSHFTVLLRCFLFP